MLIYIFVVNQLIIRIYFKKCKIEFTLLQQANFICTQKVTNIQIKQITN